MIFTRDFVDNQKIGYSSLNEKLKTLLIITFLYKENVISLDKVKGMINSLKADTFLTYKNTFHWKPDDRWYNDQHMSETLQEIVSRQVKSNTVVTIDEVITVFKLYYNSNKNYCLNAIYSEIILPVINNIEYKHSYQYNALRCTVSDIDFPVEAKDYRTSYCYYCGSEHRNKDFDASRTRELLRHFFVSKINSFKVKQWYRAPFQLDPTDIKYHHFKL